VYIADVAGVCTVKLFTVLCLAVEAASAETDSHRPGGSDESVPSEAGRHGEVGVQSTLRGAGALSAPAAGAAAQTHAPVQAAAATQLGNARQDTVSGSVLILYLFVLQQTSLCRPSYLDKRWPCAGLC